MFEDFFSESALMYLPLVGMLLFFAVFLAVLAKVVFGMRDKGYLNRMAGLPLEEDLEPAKSEDS